jgi:hypothetical protein
MENLNNLLKQYKHGDDLTIKNIIVSPLELEIEEGKYFSDSYKEYLDQNSKLMNIIVISIIHSLIENKQIYCTLTYENLLSLVKSNEENIKLFTKGNFPEIPTNSQQKNRHCGGAISILVNDLKFVERVYRGKNRKDSSIYKISDNFLNYLDKKENLDFLKLKWSKIFNKIIYLKNNKDLEHLKNLKESGNIFAKEIEKTLSKSIEDFNNDPEFEKIIKENNEKNLGLKY